MQKNKQGGKRIGAGRKKKYICSLKSVSMKLPKDYINEIRKEIKEKILINYLL